jgi:hypothetical protein
MANDFQRQTASTSRRSISRDLYQEITATPNAEPKGTEPLAAEAHQEDSGFVDLAVWIVLVASLALGFWA